MPQTRSNWSSGLMRWLNEETSTPSPSPSTSTVLIESVAACVDGEEEEEGGEEEGGEDEEAEGENAVDSVDDG